MRKSLIAFVAVAMAAFPALAHDYTAGALKIAHPWARATPKGAPVGGGYLAITNTGTTPDRLIGGSTNVSQGFEIHEMSMDNGVMKMRLLPNGVEIKPGETVTFKPSGYHIMLTGLKAPLTKGEHVDATLRFEKAGEVKIFFLVGSIGQSAPDEKSGDGAGHDMPGMKMSH
ncbi:MAG: copper chaperone PCu(A)C [Pseudolabrys sp.]